MIELFSAQPLWSESHSPPTQDECILQLFKKIFSKEKEVQTCKNLRITHILKIAISGSIALALSVGILAVMIFAPFSVPNLMGVLALAAATFRSYFIVNQLA